MKPVKVKLRAPALDDKNCIINNWLKSFRSSPFATHMINDVYFKSHEKLIKSLLDNCLITVACNPLDEWQLYGWIVFEKLADDVLLAHYAYTKRTYRKLGVAKQLFESINPEKLPMLYTHHTRAIDFLKTKTPLIYDPYKL